MAEFLQKIFQNAADWVLNSGITILIILAGAFVAHRLVHALVEKVIRHIMKPERFPSPEAEKKTEDTLIKIFHSALLFILWLVATIMVLAEAGLNIGPLLAGAGVAGLALGFGAQYLIRDVISGMFVILEHEYKVGDVVCLDSACGLVEDIDLRMTVLRDLDGALHYIPHGTVQKVSNKGQKFARINLNLGVAYESDLEKVIEVINRVGMDFAHDPSWRDKIIKPPQFLRVDDFGESAIIIKILGDTLPLQQWAAMGELRKRLKIAFDKEGIVIPYPQRVIHQGKSLES